MSDVDPATIEMVLGRFYATMGRYHAHTLVGVEHIPPTGGVLGITTHGTATYDLFLTAYALYRETGRPIHMLGDAFWFKHPRSADLMGRLGMVLASPERARRLLADGEVVAVAPGGMRAAMKIGKERYQVDWSGRSGFARLALEAQRPIVLVTCPSADRVFTLYDNPLTRLAYRRWKLPLPIFRGLGPTLLPRPVRLITTISPPINPPSIEGEAASDEEVFAFRAELEEGMNALIASACAREGLR